MIDQINCDSDTIERVFVCDVQKEIEALKTDNLRMKEALIYLQLNFPANRYLQDKCKEALR